MSTDVRRGPERVEPRSPGRIRVGVVGVGKMGLSHLSILRTHPQVDLEAVCDANAYVLDVLGSHTGVRTERDFTAMLSGVDLDAVVVATPTRAHFPMVRAALEKGLHVFCEKPLTLSAAQSHALARLAADRSLVSQVGYHNRFAGPFVEASRLLAAGAIGRVVHAAAEAYGPVVLHPRGGTWRTRRAEGGGCLYDYAAHPLDLLTWYLGEPTSVGGTHLGRIFSAETEDEVYASLFYEGGATAQLAVNWSDESYRKMSTKVTLWGTLGRITVDRQECQVYLRESAPAPPGYHPGWNVRYTTDLTPPVWFYLRGEEYSAELDYFVRSATDRLEAGEAAGLNDFTSASRTDRVIEMLIADASAARIAVPGAGERPDRPEAARDRSRAAAASLKRRLLARSDWRRGVR